jgi:hypothetical protein
MDRVATMNHSDIRRSPRRAAASGQTANAWRDTDDLCLDSRSPAEAEAGAADSDERQLIARRRLEGYLEQKRLRDALREVFQDDDWP